MTPKTATRPKSYIYRWILTYHDQRKITKAAYVGLIYDYAPSPVDWQPTSLLYWFQSVGGKGVYTKLDGKTAYSGFTGAFDRPKIVCDKPRPAYSAIWTLHSNVVRCTRYSVVAEDDRETITARTGTKHTKDTCATLCAARAYCDTFMVSASGASCLIMRGPCMSGTAQKGTFNIYRLGRGNCDALQITDTKSGLHAGVWHQAGFDHARRPVFCQYVYHFDVSCVCLLQI